MNIIEDRGTKKKPRIIKKRLLSVFLAMTMVITMAPMVPGNFPGNVYAGVYGSLTTEMPILTVSGTDLTGDTYSAASISNETSYSLEDLKAMTELTETEYYSAINSSGTKSIFLGQGIDLKRLLELSSYSSSSGSYVDAIEMNSGLKYSYSASIDLSEERLYYPNLVSDPPGEDGSLAVPSILAWADGGSRGNTSTDITLSERSSLKLMVGQNSIDDKNNYLYNSNTNYIKCGDLITGPVIEINGTSYARSEVLMMPRAEREYYYSKSVGTATDTAIGVPLGYFTEGHADDEIVTFTTADDYPVASISVADANSKNYMLAYEKAGYGEEIAGIFDVSKNDDGIVGYFTLYGDDIKPSKLIDGIDIVANTSSYKHIDNGGLSTTAPYGIDALTSATLTVEGPGVEATTPIRLFDLESTESSNIFKGDYTDTREGVDTTFKYEGVRVTSIIDGLVNGNVEKVGENIRIVFKNRWRQNVASITYSELTTAEKPVILAYGTGTEDESVVAPFVFDGDNGYLEVLGNDDGCLKLVYDQNDSGLTGIEGPDKFSSVAYLYVENIEGAPGYKHSTSIDEAFKNVANTEQLITFTGSTLGREVNYTVKQLEEMVEYDSLTNLPIPGGMGHRAEYSLSNTTYWYVNEYEGIKLWDLLTQKMGLDEETYSSDNETLVSFASWDNYKTSAEFSMAQLANADLFHYYEKSPLDIGTDRPTKEQLATEPYQPSNQGDGWTTDSNGYPVKKGYPVMLAYGVNGYPYVRDSRLEGYSGGLGNDGGPMRVIFGKTDGLNRENSSALENYGYFYNNGSNQLQRAQEIYVGNDARYSTHIENPAYASMNTSDIALTVEIVQADGSKTIKTYTLAQLENILYGSDVTKSDMEKQGRQEKGYYAYKLYNDSLIEDLYEGVNIWYLLSEDVGMQGQIGNVSLYSSSEAEADLTLTLDDLKKDGFNSLRGTSNLGPMIAFAKNGYPLVKSKDDEGYVSSDSVTGFTVKNTDGPLMFLRAQNEAEKTGSTVGSGGAVPTVSNVTRIVVNLEADVYAHTGTEYSEYKDSVLDFTGSVKNAGVTTSVGAIEMLQKYMVTDTYTISGSTKEYRGIKLDALLTSSLVGASSLMDEVTIKGSDGTQKALAVSEFITGGKSVILAYGISGPVGADPAGKPLVMSTEDNGYDATYGNSGGPLKLIIEGSSTEDCIQDVTEINVSAAILSGWKHTSGYYAEYSEDIFTFSGSNLSGGSITFTVSELEALPETYKVFDKYRVGNEMYFEGIDVLKLLRDYIGLNNGLESSAISVYAKDGYATNFTATDLSGGVNGKSIILAYGQGTSTTTGLPLVDDITSSGYDAEIGNAYGPLRLIVNDNTGWCTKWATSMVVGNATQPQPTTYDFTVTNGSIVTGYDIKTIKSVVSGQGGGVVTSYDYTKDNVPVIDYVKGVYLTDFLTEKGITGSDTTITINCTDGYETKNTSYQNISLADIEAKGYLLAYDAGGSESALSPILDTDKNNVNSTLRIYRDYDDGSTWYNRLTNIKGITVSGSQTGGDTNPDEITGDFLIFGGVNGDKGYDIKAIKNLDGGIGKVTTTAIWFGDHDGDSETPKQPITDEIKGVYMPDLLAPMNITDSDRFTIDILTTDGYQDNSYKGITLGAITAQEYFVAYDVNGIYVGDIDQNDITATVRIYRAYNDGSVDWRNRVTNVKGIEIKDAVTGEVFTLSVEGKEKKAYTISQLIDFPSYTEEYSVKDETTSATGVMLSDLLEDMGYSDDDTVIDIKTVDSFQDNLEKAGSYWGITLADAKAEKYMLSYKAGGAAVRDTVENSTVITYLRIYRNYTDDITEWYNKLTNVSGIDITPDYTFEIFRGTLNSQGSLRPASIRDITEDGLGGVRVGTYGAGAYYMEPEGNSFMLDPVKAGTTTEYALSSDIVQAIAIDSNGGTWFSQSKTYNPTQAALNKGAAYMASNGEITYYNTIDAPGTIPNDYVQEIKIDSNGNVWFGSFGGLTKYDPRTGAWKTWTMTDGLPASSVDCIEFDSRGGVWIGCYPEGSNGGTEAPFSGGYAYMNSNGTITAYTPDSSENTSDKSLADFWVRDIAVDGNDGAWIVRSGSYEYLANVGGRVDYVAADGSITHYTGKELIPDLGTSATSIFNPEIRMVAVDASANIWFGTSGLGLYKLNNRLVIKARCAGNEVDWPEEIDFDNIYALNVTDAGTVYLGSNAGVMIGNILDISEDLNIVAATPPTSTTYPGNSGGTTAIGDSTESDCDLAIVGDGVKYPGYFTVKGLKNYSGVIQQNRTYNWENTYGTTGQAVCQGVYIDNLLNDVMTLKSSAKSITITADDGYERSFNIDSKVWGTEWIDRDGNKMMLAWNVDGNKTLQLVIGQSEEGHVNKSNWVSNVAIITVNAVTTTPGSGSEGIYKPDEDEDGQGSGDYNQKDITVTVIREIKAAVNVIDDVGSAGISIRDIRNAIDTLTDVEEVEGENIKPILGINALTDRESDNELDEVGVMIPRTGAQYMIDAGVFGNIKTDLGAMMLSPQVLSGLLKEGSGDLIVRIFKSDISLTEEDHKAIAGRPVVDFTISVGGEIVTAFVDENIGIEIYHDLMDNESTSNLVALYPDGDKEGKIIKLSKYLDGRMKLKTSHLSVYAIAYNPATFDDISEHWGKENIKFLGARNIINGKSVGQFDPDGKVTRAEFIKMLVNSSDVIDVAGSKSAGFSDVKSSEWYAEYINWAAVNGVVNGYEDGSFRPYDLITREQMSIMIDNFIDASRIDLNVINKKYDFSDQSSISNWALSSVLSAQQYGIINGYSDGTFAPKSNATRAEAATVISGYIAAVINS